MSKPDTEIQDPAAAEKQLKKMARKLSRAEERLVNYEQLVDRTQHLLNTRITEVEAARHELHERTEELEASERRLRQLSDAAFEAILTHRNGEILDCNEAATELYRQSREELLGQKISDHVHPSHLDRASKWLEEPVDDPVEVTLLRGDDTTVPVEVRTRAINLKGRAALVTVIRDITAHKELQEQLRHIANSDPLTGVGNRRYFMEVGNSEFFRAVRYHQPMSLLMLDVDHFKNINDTYGHEIGDIALCSLTKSCLEALRDSDIFARIGGEEFTALMPNTGLKGAANLAERLRVAVESSTTETDQGKISFTVSIGVATMGAEDDGIEAMLNRADQGLYKAKESGRNRIVTE